MAEGQVTVYFKLWGQICSTVFDVTSELAPLDWLQTMEEKGWLLPVEIVTADGIVVWSKEAE